MFDEKSGEYDQPLSIRAILKSTKVDIAMMDFLAWSPAACQEIKRLATKVRKKAPKQDKQPTYQFNPALFQQPMQSVPTLFNPYQAPVGLPQQNPYQAGGQANLLQSFSAQAERYTRILTMQYWTISGLMLLIRTESNENR